MESLCVFISVSLFVKETEHFYISLFATDSFFLFIEICAHMKSLLIIGLCINILHLYMNIFLSMCCSQSSVSGWNFLVALLHYLLRNSLCCTWSLDWFDNLSEYPRSTGLCTPVLKSQMCAAAPCFHVDAEDPKSDPKAFATNIYPQNHFSSFNYWLVLTICSLHILDSNFLLDVKEADLGHSVELFLSSPENYLCSTPLF